MRKYPENEILARPGVRIAVGFSNADITGRDNRALQAAVDYVAGLGGGTVEIGPGEYLMRDSLHLRSGITLRGLGEKTVLKKDAAVTSRLAVDGDFGEEAITVEDPTGFDIGRGVHVSGDDVGGFNSICATIVNKDGAYLAINEPLNNDCQVSHNAYAATVYPVISAYNIQDFHIENLTVDGNRSKNPYITGCRGAGIFFYRGDGAVIAKCIIRNYNGDGISFQQSNDVQVLHCLSEYNAGKGVHPGSGSQRAMVRGCRLLSNDGDGFYFCWRVRNARAEANEIRGNGGYGVSIGHKDSDNLVTGNVIVANKKGGVYWRDEPEPLAAHRIVFVDNTVEDNVGFGLFIEGEADGTVIRNNTIRDTGARVQRTGIRVGARAGSVTLDGNSIDAETPVSDERPGGSS